MADYEDIATNLLPDSDIVRIYPNKLVQFYISGTNTLQWQGTSDASGKLSVSTLPTGKYDIKVDGQHVRTIQHVKADHTHPFDETWRWFISGAISADSNESNAREVFATAVQGTILEVRIIAERLTNAGDVTVHLLKAATGGAAQLVFASNSVYSKRVYVGGATSYYRYMPTPDVNPGITLAANESLTVGIDYVAAGVEGLTVIVKFRPNS